MSYVAETASMNVRRTQQRRVAALLDEIAVRRHRLYVLKAYGVRRAGMRSLKAELGAVRDELARGHQRGDLADAARERRAARTGRPFGVARRRLAHARNRLI